MGGIFDSDRFQKYRPPNPITSLRCIQTLYGAINEATSESGSPSSYSIYHTPEELTEFIADTDHPDRYLLSLTIDLTTKQPTVDDVSVDLTRLTSDLVAKLGFARYPWGGGIDHSITRRGAKAGADAEKATQYSHECLQRWPNTDGREPAIGKIADTHSDGWIITTLQKLGTDDRFLTHIEDAIAKRITDTPRLTVTVRLRLDPTDVTTTLPAESTTPTWLYPGQIDVLNAAMQARKEAKLSRKNLSSESPPASGQGVCMVTNTPSTVVGTAEDPLALYTMQHTEKFPALNRVHAWQTQSLTPTTAILLQASTAFLDACRTTRHGLSIYTLPYFATITQERAALLARGLRRLMDREFDSSTQHPMAFIENVVEQHGDARDQTALRFYVLSLHNNGGDRNVYHENPNVTLYWPRKIARSYLDRLTTPFATAYSHHVRTTNSSLLNSTVIEKDIINAIVSGAYAWNTLTPPTEDRASINESTEWYTYQLLSGSSICLDWLLEEFIARLRTDRTTNPAHRLHGLTLPLQFLQLEALASAGILTATPGSSALTTPPSPMHTDTLDVTHLQRSDGSITRTAVRRYRLQHFLDNRPAFTENPERRGSFLIGVLVGQLSHHQQSSRNMQRTLRDQHHADTITPQSLTRLYHRLIDTAGMYATDVDWAGQLLFPETVDALTDTLSTINPTDWTLSHPDLQFFYALGVSYGLRTDRHTTELIETTRSTATTDHPNASPEP